jgi:hypothetical protein
LCRLKHDSEQEKHGCKVLQGKGLCLGPSWTLEINGLKTCEKGAGLEIFFIGLLTLVLQE